jgi:hypothetical protein
MHLLNCSTLIFDFYLSLYQETNVLHTNIQIFTVYVVVNF